MKRFFKNNDPPVFLTHMMNVLIKLSEENNHDRKFELCCLWLHARSMHRDSQINKDSLRNIARRCLVKRYGWRVPKSYVKEFTDILEYMFTNEPEEEHDVNILFFYVTNTYKKLHLISLCPCKQKNILIC